VPPSGDELMQNEPYEQFCRGVLADPYPLLHELREQEPVHWPARLNAWMITRYDDFLRLGQTGCRAFSTPMA
jgi:cytochrome P450